MADGLARHEAAILRANAIDVANANARGVEAYFVDRLTLTPDRLAAIAKMCAMSPHCPIRLASHLSSSTLPNGLRLHKRRIPLGVIAVIYESRPNVTIDIAALCLKSSNAAILRGGSDNMTSNKALLAVVHEALQAQRHPARRSCAGGRPGSRAHPRAT